MESAVRFIPIVARVSTRNRQSLLPSQCSLLRTLLLICTALAMGGAAHAQSCPEPWASAPFVYGIMVLVGSGTNLGSPTTFTTDQTIVLGMQLSGSVHFRK
jgi:uncharacterized membrane protein AbrB (regulator of aidB expression)